MRSVFLKMLAGLAAVVLMISGASAAEYGSKADAKAMAEKAAAFFVANGKDKAFEAFNTGSDGFKDRDLYVFAYDDTGTCVAHGANKGLIGKNLIEFKDVDGKPLIREIVSVKDTGWVEFKWKNPSTNEIQKKTSFIVRNGGLVFGVGAYQPN